MAIYHMSAQVISRSAGRSATAAAAYRAGEKIVDERTGEVHDYTRKQGVDYKEIIAPEHAGWATDRAALWNQSELAEKRKDAQVAREINVAIPKELDAEKGRELVREYAKDNFVKQGMIADICIHGEKTENPHAHIMLTMREAQAKGLADKKNRQWNDKEQLEKWREDWAHSCNKMLEREGLNISIDHRSLKDQGINREATAHLGPTANQMEQRGAESDRGNINRAIQSEAAELERLKSALENVTTELSKLQAEREEFRPEVETVKVRQIVEQAQPKPEAQKPISASDFMKSFQAKKQEAAQAAQKPRSASAIIREQQEAKKAQDEQARNEAKGKDFKDLPLDAQKRIIADLQKASRNRNLETEIQSSPEYKRIAEQLDTAQIRTVHAQDDLRKVQKEKDGLSFYQIGKKKELEQKELDAREAAKRQAFEVQLKKEEMEALRQQKTAELSPQIEAHNAKAETARQQLRELEPIHAEKMREAREQERAQTKDRGGYER